MKSLKEHKVVVKEMINADTTSAGKKAYPGLGQEQEALLAHFWIMPWSIRIGMGPVWRDQTAILAFAPFR